MYKSNGPKRLVEWRISDWSAVCMMVVAMDGGGSRRIPIVPIITSTIALSPNEPYSILWNYPTDISVHIVI